MINKNLSKNEKILLLKIAREAISDRYYGNGLPQFRLAELPQKLQENGASFVTLTINGQLRGCIGTLRAYQPLAIDVKEHALAAAFQDYRFPPLKEKELEKINVEISVLSNPVDLDYKNPIELIQLLTPFEDGVVLEDNHNRATFLPQVWEQLPNPEDFLSHLCQKMGLPKDTWREKKLLVQIYHVEKFKEN